MTLLVHLLQYQLHLSEITDTDIQPIMTDTDYRTDYLIIIIIHTYHIYTNKHFICRQ